MKSLLTTGNPKTAKGEGLGYLTAILHLAPATMSGRNTCPWSTAGCRAACLNTAGRGGISKGSATFTCHDGTTAPANNIQKARIRKTREFHADRAAFVAQLTKEIGAHVRRAARHGLAPAVRLNGTSDLPWETLAPELFASFPTVQFYDYTKGAVRVMAHLNGRLPANYHLTFSRAESNTLTAATLLLRGANVAVVFDTKKGSDLPSMYARRGVVDGDLTDLRFLDGRGVVVGLRAKGKGGKADDSGFVVAS